MHKIMIVDDDAQLRAALSVRLRRAGFEVAESGSPESARRDILHAPPDLILLDIDMPQFNGLDFHECLKYANRSREIPVVYLSGRNTPVFLEEAFRRGARAFIAKPYDPHELVAVLRGVLGAAGSDGKQRERHADNTDSGQDAASRREPTPLQG